jgi:tripartite-type tricarboxylate transporter receptor subunit TctC
MFFDTVATSVPMYRADKVKIIGVGSSERTTIVPEVPTIAESGLPGFRSVTWFAMVAPPGLPTALAERINQDVVGILKRPDISEKLQRVTLEPLIGSPSDATKFFAEERSLWGKVIRERNVTSE